VNRLGRHLITSGGGISSPAAHGYAALGASNWIWLSELSRFERVADVGGTIAHSLGLAEHFASVVRVTPRDDPDSHVIRGSDDPGGSVMTVSGSLAALPLRTASVDCVALRTELESVVAARAAFREARRVLRAGGCASFGFENRSWVGAARARRKQGRAAGPSISVRGVGHLARAAGFKSLELFYVDPAFVAPATLLPRSRAATGFLEVHRPTESRMGPVRRLLARSGMHRLLYPAYLGIAYL
jgi:SAM-dependent methyltransferase